MGILQPEAAMRKTILMAARGVFGSLLLLSAWLYSVVRKRTISCLSCSENPIWKRPS